MPSKGIRVINDSLKNLYGEVAIPKKSTDGNTICANYYFGEKILIKVLHELKLHPLTNVISIFPPHSNPFQDENYLYAIVTMKESDNFYLQQPEPIRSCLLALREIILSQDKEVSSAWKYGMPFFCYKGKMFCYLWVHKKHKRPYLGIVEGNRIHHPDLISEKRSRMKIILFDTSRDLPIRTINTILKLSLDLYKAGVIKIAR